jgi:polyhydroxyalkanoate synthesis regulator phasin
MGIYTTYSDHEDDDGSAELQPTLSPKLSGKLSPKMRTNGGATTTTPRNVQFAPTNEFFDIPHLNDMTDEDIANIWYEAGDYNEIKASYQLVIIKMETGEFREDEEQTCRGLEYRTQDGAWTRYENKRDAYNAVLDEQDRQWKVDKDDHEKISTVYRNHSKKCADAAADRGSSDAKEAREICEDILKRRKIRKKKSTKSTSGRKEPEPETSSPVPRVDDFARQVLKQRSFSRRNEIRDDIKKQQANKALKKETRKAVVV